MNRAAITGCRYRLRRSSIAACMFALLSLMAHARTSYSQDATLTKEEEEELKLVLIRARELRSRNMDQIAKAANARFNFLGLHLDKIRSVPRIGYFVWGDFFRDEYYFENKLIRIDATLDNNTALAVAALRKKYGEPTDGTKFELTDPIEQEKREREVKISQYPRGSYLRKHFEKQKLNFEGFEVTKRYHWDTKATVRIGEQDLEIPVTIDVTEIGSAAKPANDDEWYAVVSVSDSEQLEKTMKALAEK